MNEDVIVPKQESLHKYYIMFQLNRTISDFLYEFACAHYDIMQRIFPFKMLGLDE